MHPTPPARATESVDAVGGRESSRALAPADFARLYQEHRGVLWCAAVGVLGDRTLAQDVVQQAAVVGLERLGSFAPETSFVAWMVQIVRNLAMNEARKRARRATTPTDALVLDATETARRTPHEAQPAVDGRGQPTGIADFDDELLKALRTLDETARGCLLMRVVLDLPYRQIALALDIPEGTAASHVHRARSALRDALRGGRNDSQWRPA